ncbi:hypothetical protein HOR18_gp189 [Staphylococcus phage vB_SscM-1]|uniref:Uncharacterized protein n=2 Tax=Sciuriunavirus SscM1 TaxID=2734053 RepID=A0A1X9IA04_9CAUD|nr:hypothetical protein HOR18_gp189 [Staphylococcus phage vB_SscM-1]ANT44852.1 hypothetical protein vB_SscM-1_188 [Staphylococcus phage vB_SscM-1]ANT45054.1 hypothetical protein vB_SscM-2_187 [Staphylococcus phage vB_SscM-2]
MKNIEELLSIITKGMSEKDIELTHIDLYEKAVSINREVKVCIGDDWFLVCRIEFCGSFTTFKAYSTDSMLDKVLELLTEDDWLPGDDIENDLECCTLVVENDCYRLLYNDYSISDRMTLNYLKSNYTNASLEKRLR